MSKHEQSQAWLHQRLAEVVNQEVVADGFLITVSFVDLSPDLKRAVVGISVLPDKFYGTALERLRQATGRIRSRLAKGLKWRIVPQLKWEIDNRPRQVAELEEVFREIKDDLQ